MPWVRLDEEFPDHPKVVTAGPLAGWLHVCALAYCNRYLTDGFVARAQVKRLADFDGIVQTEDAEWDDDVRDVPGVDPYKLAEVLVSVGMWEKCQGGYRLHNYHEYQPSRAEIEAQRKVKAQAGKLGGQRSGEARRSKPEAESKQNGSTSEADHEADHEAETKHGASGLVPRLVPGRLNPDPVPDTDTDTNKVKTLASADAERQPARAPDPLWDSMLAACGVVGQPTASARGAYNRARKELANVGATPEEIHRRADILRAKWPDVDLTPSSLARHWAEATHPPARVATNGARRVSASQDAITRVFAALPEAAP